MSKTYVALVRRLRVLAIGAGVLIFVAGNVVEVVAAENDKGAICRAGERYAIAFDGEFDQFRPYDRATGKGTWDTRYPWGRSNPGTHTAAFDIDATYRGRDGTLVGVDPFGVHGGVLSISPSRLAPAAAAEVRYPYATGVITTRYSFAQQYGYFETRMRASGARGIVSAFWLMPVSGWPPEIDVVEILGAQPERIYQSLHTADHRSMQSIWKTTDASKTFHTYAIRWTADEITYFVDNVQTARFPNISNQPMYLLADIDVGGPGGWEGEPDATTFPTDVQIEFIRAYRATGAACEENDAGGSRRRRVAPVR